MTHTFKLYTGTNNEIKTEAQEGETANWLLAIGESKNLHIIESDPLDAFYDRLELLTHYSNGDFSAWSADRHFPRRVLLVPDGFTVSGDAQLLSSSAVKDSPIDEIRKVNGEWFEYYQGKTIGKAAPARAYYHEVVRWLLDGQSVALRIPNFLGNEYARTILETLNLGIGKAWAMRIERREEAKAEKQAYKAVRNQVLNGQGEQFGYANTTKKMMVKTPEGIRKDMFTVASGTIAQVCSSNGNVLYPLAWQPEDEINIESWKALSEPSCVLRILLP